MDTYIARQPIFNKNKEVHAYELLYRTGVDNVASVLDGDAATSSVIANSLMVIGLEKLTEGRPAFINFTKKLISDEIATVFDPKMVVVEILEDIIPDEKFLSDCRKLKEMGYTLALDDVVLEYPYEELMAMVDIIKVDFLLTKPWERKALVQRFKDSGVQFLAEKVETNEQFKEAVEAGYTYFQGYFFAKPKLLARRSIKSYALNYARIVTELNKPEPEYEKISKIIEYDVSMSYKLLRLINSAAFVTNSRITSIKHALVLLGFKEIKKWISIVMLQDIGSDKPDEILRSCLLRGKMGESLATTFGLKHRKDELFLLGVFSMIDTLMDLPMEEAIQDLPFEDDIKEALLGKPNAFHEILTIVVAYEKGNWDFMFLKAQEHELAMSVFPDAYIDAVKWTTTIFESEKQAG